MTDTDLITFDDFSNVLALVGGISTADDRIAESEPNIYDEPAYADVTELAPDHPSREFFPESWFDPHLHSKRSANAFMRYNPLNTAAFAVRLTDVETKARAYYSFCDDQGHIDLGHRRA